MPTPTSPTRGRTAPKQNRAAVKDKTGTAKKKPAGTARNTAGTAKKKPAGTARNTAGTAKKKPAGTAKKKTAGTARNTAGEARTSVRPDAKRDHAASTRPDGLGLGGWETKALAAVREALPRRSNGGVAPFVPPARRAKTAWALRRFERRGFVPLTPGRPKRRHRILPRSVIGIATVLLALGVGAAFSGATFYAYYDTRLAENEETVARFVEGFDQQFTDATGTLDELRLEAVSDIRAELSPLGDYVDDANGVIGLPATAGPSVWHLQTRDEAGEPVNGAAFAVARHDGGTAFVTSHALIVASLTAPNPPIELVKGEQRLAAQLWTWDAELDVAVVVVEAEIPPLVLAAADEQVASVGARTFALSGVGGQGATASPGVLLDQSRSGLQHTAPVGSLFVGGPLLNGAGKVVGVASLAYQPHDLDPGRVLSAPDVPGICQSILACAEDAIEGLAVDIPVGRPEAPPAPAASGD
jgi:hypothetical protein